MASEENIETCPPREVPQIALLRLVRKLRLRLGGVRAAPLIIEKRLIPSADKKGSD
jgi:hypothetical protein